MRRRNRARLVIAIVSLCVAAAVVWAASAQEETERQILQPVGEARRITQGAHTVSPSWSPDGRRIAYVDSVEEEESAKGILKVVTAVPGARVVILAESASEEYNETMLPEYGARWSPDGKHLMVMFGRRRGGFGTLLGRLWVVDARTGAMSELSEGKTWVEPIWTGRAQIAYSKLRARQDAGRGELALFDTQSGAARTILSDEEAESVRPLCTCADGQSLLVGLSPRIRGDRDSAGKPRQGTQSEGFSLETVRLSDGSRTTWRRLQTGEWVRSAEPLGQGGSYLLWILKTNPRLLVTRTEDTRAVGESHVVVADAEKMSQLTRRDLVLFPTASPDGEWIAYVKHIPLTNDDGETKGVTASLWAVDSRGSTPQQLIAQDVDCYSRPSWSPEGDAIAYTKGGDIFVQPVESTEHRTSRLDILPPADRAYVDAAANDLIQIGQAIEMYRNDWDDCYPPPGVDAAWALEPYVFPDTRFLLDWLNVATVSLPGSDTSYSVLTDPSDYALISAEVMPGVFVRVYADGHVEIVGP